MTKVRWNDLLFGLLIVWSGGATIVALRTRMSNAEPPGHRVAAATPVSDWRQVAERGYRFGPQTAALTVVVFSDFECPFCRRFAAVVDSLRVKHPDVQFVERHFPLTALHAQARNAAYAAECARDVGRYPDMRRILFEKDSLIKRGDWGRLATLAGIEDTVRLVTCVRDGRHADAISADVAAGKALGVLGTPAVLVNDTLYERPPALDFLERRYTAALLR